MKITRISESFKDKERMVIYVDGVFCCSIRKRTFAAMNLSVGLEITCAEIQEKEKFFFKHAYADSWVSEKERLSKVCAFVQGVDPRIKTVVTGFGADSTEFIKEHPEESGKPDIEVVLRDDQTCVLLLVEVSGTQTMRGTTYWVRPDKLDYIKSHPEQDVWIILHYAKPQEKLIFIKPDGGKHYHHSSKVIRDATEYFVEFSSGDLEVKSEAEFVRHLKAKL